MGGHIAHAGDDQAHEGGRIGLTGGLARGGTTIDNGGEANPGIDASAGRANGGEDGPSIAGAMGPVSGRPGLGGRAGPPPNNCDDNQRNGQETDVDCGGPECRACSDELVCVVGTDCESAM